MRLGKAVYNQQKDKATNYIKKTVNEENILNLKENWRNLISTLEVFNEEDYNKEKLIIDELIDDFFINNEVFETVSVASPVSVASIFPMTSIRFTPINEVIPSIQSMENITEKNVSKIITICRKKLTSFFLLNFRTIRAL